MPPYAKIEITGDEIRAQRFDDIYYSRESGIEESRYVFLEGNELPLQWQKKSNYCIAETGFGTGLNFLVTAQAWLDDPAHSETLDYFSVEAFPIAIAQLKTIHAQWPEFSTLSKKLIAQYPKVANGCHSLSFNDGKIQLHLIFETLADALDHYALSPNCWFLDGFAPSKNPSMWRKALLSKIGECSKPNTQLATFTAAGQVRRDLIAAGFTVSKRKGFGRKREMLCARKSLPMAPQQRFKHAPWFHLRQDAPPLNSAIVIGSGIAGAQIAYQLAQRGVKVCVIDSQSEIATGASGNLAGVIAPKLSAKPSDEEAFYISAFLYQLNQIHILKSAGNNIDFFQDGLIQIAHNNAALERFEQLANRRDLDSNLLRILSADNASKLLGEHINAPVMRIKLAGTVSPRQLCQALLRHPNIKLKLNTRIDEIKSVDRQHTLISSDGHSHCANTVVIANGHHAADFSENIELIPVRGQTCSATLKKGQLLKQAVGHAGYIIPASADGQKLIFGASYQRGNCSSELAPQDTKSNFESLQQHLPHLANQLDNIEANHAGIRATTLDHWPIVGPLPHQPFYLAEYSDIANGKQYKNYQSAQYRQGLYVLSGLGSRGLTSAAYCANLLTHMIFGYTPPAPQKHLQAMLPARFLIRMLKKNSSL